MATQRAFQQPANELNLAILDSLNEHKVKLADLSCAGGAIGLVKKTRNTFWMCYNHW